LTFRLLRPTERRCARAFVQKCSKRFTPDQQAQLKALQDASRNRKRRRP
jgi:hypothetical protein